MEEIRKSYLRDVVNVKIYLEKISKYDIVEVDKYNYLAAISKSGRNVAVVIDDDIELSPYQQQQRQIQEQQIRQLRLQQSQIKEEIVGIEGIPSTDMRGFIKRAIDAVNDSSAQVRDNLLEAGVIDIQALRTLNPWEQSSAYTRTMKQKRGHFFSLPKSSGECIPLAAPSNHKLFVRYCNECIGMIALVRSWNLEVEDAMRFRLEHGAMDQQNAELRKLIAKLNGIIETQEESLLKEMAKNKELEEANAWFNNWTDTQRVDALGNELKDARRQLMEVGQMAQAEVESTALNVSMAMRHRIASALHVEETLHKLVRKERLMRENEVKSRIQMYEDLQKTQKELVNAEKEIVVMTDLRNKETERVVQVQKQAAALQQTITTLERACLFKDNVYNELRAESTLKIEFLKQQVGDLSNQCQQLEKSLEASSEQVRSLKVRTRPRPHFACFFASQKD